MIEINFRIEEQKLIQGEFVRVEPLKSPDGRIFSMKYRYGSEMKNNPTAEDLLEAKELLKNFKVCGSGGAHGCGKVFPVKELENTIQWGQEYFWCPPCYEKIKDDW